MLQWREVGEGTQGRNLDTGADVEVKGESCLDFSHSLPSPFSLHSGPPAWEWHCPQWAGPSHSSCPVGLPTGQSGGDFFFNWDSLLSITLTCVVWCWQKPNQTKTKQNTTKPKNFPKPQNNKQKLASTLDKDYNGSVILQSISLVLLGAYIQVQSIHLSHIYPSPL